MTSTTRKIPASEWEIHKDTIARLYSEKTLKDVRTEMQSQHGFTASPWQYEMQLKRWGIRKYATQNEWQQFFSGNAGSTSTTADARGGPVLPVIRGKSHASKRRARRWALGTPVVPNAAQRAPGPAQPETEAHTTSVSVLNEPTALTGITQLETQDVWLNPANALQAREGVSMNLAWNLSARDEAASSNLFTTHGFPGSPSHAFFGASSVSAYPPDARLTPFSFASSSMMLDFQPLDSELGSFDWAVLQAAVGLPARNSMTFFSILEDADMWKSLPFARLEQNLRFRSIVLGRAAGGITGLVGFASESLASILPSAAQSMVPRTSDREHFLRKLCSLIPGESSALITDNQDFETNFARMLLFSVLNGFAGLNDVPLKEILRFLNRVVVNKLLLDILEQSPRHVSRTLADNIFRAAIEAADTKVVTLLLQRKLVAVNDTVCFYYGENLTPIERAVTLRSLELVQSLITAGADVNKFHANNNGKCTEGGALIRLMTASYRIAGAIPRFDKRVKASESIKIFNALIAAGARVHNMMLFDRGAFRVAGLGYLLSLHTPPEEHHSFFNRPPRHMSHLEEAVDSLDDWNSTQIIRNMIELCNNAGCKKCLGKYGAIVDQAIIEAAYRGHIETVNLLFASTDTHDRRSRLNEFFTAAVMSQNSALIEVIISHGPDLDPPCALLQRRERQGFLTTPIAESVRNGDEDLIRRLEAAGALDRLAEGNRFQPLISAAAETGNSAYMEKILARAVTSRQAYRVGSKTLLLAIEGGYRGMAQMLLEAGARVSRREPPAVAIQGGDTQMVYDLINHAEAEVNDNIEFSDVFVLKDKSMLLDLVREFPCCSPRGRAVSVLCRECIETESTEFFKEFLDIISVPNCHDGMYLDDCLKTAIKSGHVDMIGYLLDVGANPSSAKALRAATFYRPDMLQLLFRKEMRRQNVPKCIGAGILISVMGHGAGNTEALDELLKTQAMNFARINGHIGCRDLISELSGISVDRLDADEYGAPWIAY